MNARWCELSGVAAEDALGDGWASTVHPDDLARVAVEWEEAARTGRDPIVEFRFLRPDGVRCITAHASALRDANGWLVGWLGTCLDVTPHREAEAALAVERERFKVAFERAPLGMALVDRDGRWLEVNPALCELLGYTRDELRGRTFLDVTHPDDRLASEDRRGRCLDGRPDPEPIEKRYVRADGVVVWARVCSTPVRAADGTVLYTVAHIENIDGRVHAERALREAEERFRHAFEAAPIGMALVSPDGFLLRVNEAFCTLLGYSSGELVGRSFREITHPDDAESDAAHARRLLDGEAQSFRKEKRYLHRLGHAVWGELSASLVRDGDGRPLYFVSQIEEIGERKRREQSLEELASLDPLTGLLNRRAFEQRLEEAAARARAGAPAALILVDVDRFKAVNDTYGHAAGDAALVAVGELLRTSLRRTDAVARLGGDEFAAILVESPAPQSARVAEQLVERVRALELVVDGVPIPLTASAGTAAFAAGLPADAVYAAADAALYEAKRGGRDRSCGLDRAA